MLSLLFKAILIYFAFIFIRGIYRAYKTYVVFRNAATKNRSGERYDGSDQGDSIEAEYRVVDKDKE